MQSPWLWLRIALSVASGSALATESVRSTKRQAGGESSLHYQKQIGGRLKNDTATSGASPFGPPDPGTRKGSHGRGDRIG